MSIIDTTPVGLDALDVIGFRAHRNLPGIIALVIHQKNNLGGIYFAYQESLSALSLPEMETLGYDLVLYENKVFTSLSAPLLKSAVAEIAIYENPILRFVVLPSLVFAPTLKIYDNDELEGIELPLFNGPLVGLTRFDANPVLKYIHLPALESFGNEGLSAQNNPSLTSIVLTSLVNGGTDNFNISGDVTLTTVSLPAMITCATGLFQSINAAGCTLLANVSFPNYLPTNGRNITFTGCALSQASVDHILARAVANPAYVSGTINTTGGTSATPGAQGILDKATLQARGVTVLTN